MWELYDRLIEQIPEGMIVRSIHQGPVRTMVRANFTPTTSIRNVGRHDPGIVDYCGISATINENDMPIPYYGYLEGRSLREVASLCKSWDFFLASIGTAALNAWFNNIYRLLGTSAGPRIDASAGMKDKVTYIDSGNTFYEYAEAFKNKKTAIIGHFRILDTELFESCSQVSVLERHPHGSDLPDSACEYILPEADLVFITGTAFINKTLPRLLELSLDAHTIVIGPTTPMSPVLFEYGINEAAGLLLGSVPEKDYESICAGRIKPSASGRRINMVPREKTEDGASI